jgi:peptidoglycan/LPS O-acetylase OafA/YrhL
MDTPQTSAGTRAPTARHLPALDGVRGVAILLVFLYHFGGPFKGEPGLPQKLIRVGFAGGWIGVDLFFVLSGFLITRNLLSDTGDSRGTLLRFWRNRALRIFPLYYLFLIALSLLGDVPDASYWLYYCNWTQPFRLAELGSVRSHLWSLAVEEQFYLLWPFAVLFSSRQRFARLCWSIVLLAPVLRAVAVWSGVEPMLIYRATAFRIDALVWGALLALGIRWSRLVWWGVGLTIPTVIICRGFQFGVSSMQIVGYSGIALSCAAVVGWAAQRSPRVLQARALRLAGKYSYGAYLLHWPLAAAVWDRMARAPVTLLEQVAWMALGSLAVFAAAAACYEILEKRFLSLRSEQTSGARQ